MLKGDITDSSLFKDWLREKYYLRESSIYTYYITVEDFLKRDPDLSNIEDYNKFLIEKTIKGRNYHYYSVIKRFVEWKLDDIKLRNEILENLVKPVMKQNIKRERKYIEEAKIYEMISHIKIRKHQIMAWIQHETGLRAGDILKLRKGTIINEVYEDKNVISLRVVGKRDKRIVATIFNEDLQTALLDFINGNVLPMYEDYYFLDYYSRLKERKNKININNINGIMMRNYRWYWEDMKIACNAVGLSFNDFATHDYRRCFARRVWEVTKDLPTLQRILNHSSIQTTMRYLEQSGMANIDIYKKMQSK
jgi:integrase